MSARRLEQWFSTQKHLGFFIVKGRQYDVRVTVDAWVIPLIFDMGWRMRKDGHLVNREEKRLSHVIWFLKNGYFPEFGEEKIRYINGDTLDNRVENLAILKVTPQSPESGDSRPPSASPSLSEVVGLSPAPLSTLSPL